MPQNPQDKSTLALTPSEPPKPTILMFLTFDGTLLPRSNTPPGILEMMKQGIADTKKTGDTTKLKTVVQNFNVPALESIHKVRKAVESTGARFAIVVSGSLRANLSLKELAEVLQFKKDDGTVSELDFSQYIIGKTAAHTEVSIPVGQALTSFSCNLNRGELVETWLMAYANQHNVVNFVAVDFDDAEKCYSELPSTSANFVHVNGDFGFSETDAKNSIDILSKPPRPETVELLNAFRTMQTPADTTGKTESSEQVPIPISEKRRQKLLEFLNKKLTPETGTMPAVDSETKAAKEESSKEPILFLQRSRDKADARIILKPTTKTAAKETWTAPPR